MASPTVLTGFGEHSLCYAEKELDGEETSDRRCVVGDWVARGVAGGFQAS
ncbi:hypothetical protein [Streptomyces avermitilis]